jgi:serine/threonine protein kinase
MAAITKHKVEAIKLAREQGIAVQEMCRRAKTDIPPYEFEELIGKGAYGRVYKGHETKSGRLVAIKVLDIDSLDYKSLRDFRDESIKDFIHETKVMKQVKDAGAKNINELIEAISIHSQLWLVCEYCPGGSVRTLVIEFLFFLFRALLTSRRCVQPTTNLMKNILSQLRANWPLVFALFMRLESSTVMSKVSISTRRW